MKTSILALAILGALSSAVQAAPNDGIVGAYARVEVGHSSFGLSGPSTRLEKDDHGQAAKIFGGYRFDNGLGFEAGYAALGRFSETIAVGSSSVQQEAKARSVFAAATGRLPVGDGFALHGRLGLSAGRVTGTDVLPEADRLTGAKTSALIGLGAEYRPRSNIALTLNYDNYGKLSDTVSASALLFGLHFTF
jgi:OmpA-OmpF porin, OOP family